MQIATRPGTYESRQHLGELLRSGDDRSLPHVLMVHAEYVNPGGEESIFDSEAALLERHGHRVTRHRVMNRTFLDMNSLRGAAKTIWNQEEYRQLRDLIQQVSPDIVHFHNTFPAISPSGYYAAKAEGLPVVQSLHNFRMFCLNTFCFRDGSPCEDCLGRRIPWPGVHHNCHPRGRGVSASVATMLTVHRLARTWHRMVDVFINAATQFSKQKLIAGGVPAGKIITKPNFLDPDPGMQQGGGGYALFVGRMSAEKGIDTLLKAWEQIPEDISLRIMGGGPMSENVVEGAREVPNVEYLGRRPLDEVVEQMGRADVLIFPSQWYEGMPRTIIESFAVGTPIIATEIGGLPEMIEHGHNGLTFPSGDSTALAERVRLFFSPEIDRDSMRQRARQTFEGRYTAEDNYRQLTTIYQRAAQACVASAA
jgi:glycosyltransferase involved in cell wall biosynthesis